MLVSGTFAGYQMPFCLLMSGHIIPQESIAPKSVERFTLCEQIIPAPTYVRLKSKKNLIVETRELGQLGMPNKLA
jgi:hypothetical protein